jgi:hypothetical protein
MAQPAAQAFRIEKQLADLRWVPGRQGTPLTEPQRKEIRALLAISAKVTFEQIYKALKKADCPQSPGRWLNLARGGRDELTGDNTTAAFRRLELLNEWRALDEVDQMLIINLLAAMGSPEVFDQPGWETRLTRKDGEPRTLWTPVVDFINRMVATGKLGRLSAMNFDSGRSAYSIKALHTLTALLRDRGIDEQNALEAAYPKAHDPPAANPADLPPHKPTGNVAVDVALRQLRHSASKRLSGTRAQGMQRRQGRPNPVGGVGRRPRDPERWRIVEERVERFRRRRIYGKARQLLAQDFEQEVLDDAAIAGFSERQFHEGAWIARLAAQWLQQVCRDVVVSRGLLTAHLRRVWRLDTVIPQVRLEEDLPIFDRDEEEISREDFARYQDSGRATRQRSAPTAGSTSASTTATT